MIDGEEINDRLMIEFKSIDYGDEVNIGLIDSDLPKERGRGVGRIAVWEDGTIAGLEVDEDYRRRGYGSMLLRKAEQIAKEKYNKSNVNLYCHRERFTFYLDRGYVYKTVGGDHYIMTKEI